MLRQNLSLRLEGKPYLEIDFTMPKRPRHIPKKSPIHGTTDSAFDPKLGFLSPEDTKKLGYVVKRMGRWKAKRIVEQRKYIMFNLLTTLGPKTKQDLMKEFARYSAMYSKAPDGVLVVNYGSLRRARKEKHVSSLRRDRLRRLTITPLGIEEFEKVKRVLKHDKIKFPVPDMEAPEQIPVPVGFQHGGRGIMKEVSEFDSRHNPNHDPLKESLKVLNNSFLSDITKLLDVSLKGKHRSNSIQGS